GFNVLHPMGWDSFGLPAENAAIKSGIPPREWTNSNIAQMKAVCERFGFGYDWQREISSCEPEYYHWNQWFFLRMLEKGLAYRKRSRVNWCPQCGTVLANEQVVNGCCWRHETTIVEPKEVEQWFLRITHYSDSLLDGTVALAGRCPGNLSKCSPRELTRFSAQPRLCSRRTILFPTVCWKECLDARLLNRS